jgi:hypothetical protein
MNYPFNRHNTDTLHLSMVFLTVDYLKYIYQLFWTSALINPILNFLLPLPCNILHKEK